MIFLKTEYEKSKVRVKPLSRQQLKDGTPIDCTWNVTCDKEIRERYSMGTIFVVNDIEKAGINYYKVVGNLRVLQKAAPVNEIATEAEFRAYSAFIGEEFTPEEPEEPEEPNVHKVSYMDNLYKKYPVPEIADTGFYIDPEMWYLSIRNIKQQINTMYLGPTGIGKTSLVELVSEELGLQFKEHDMGSMLDPMAGLLGTHRLDKEGSIFDFADFTRDITEPGVVLLDELSRAPATANNILFPTLDYRRRLNVAIAEAGKREILMHEKCSVVATANEGGQYTGTTQMDKALKSRFFLLEMDYMKDSNEKEVLRKRMGISNSEAAKIVSVANAIRTVYKRGDLSDAPGTRETIMAAAMVRDGYAIIKAIEYSFLPLFEGTKSEGERSIVVNIITSK